MAWNELWQHPEIRQPLAVCLGAIPGALSRYYLGSWLTQRLGTEFPYGTFMINLSGCFVMGLVSSWLERRLDLSPEVRLLVAVGFLGSYTTFSTYALDVSALGRAEAWGSGLVYGVGSAILGVLGLELGRGLVKLLWP